jgi:hypothetical protein
MATSDAAAERQRQRSHRFDDKEFYRLLAGEVIDDATLFNTKLHEWERFRQSAKQRHRMSDQ